MAKIYINGDERRVLLKLISDREIWLAKLIGSNPREVRFKKESVVLNSLYEKIDMYGDLY